MPTTTLPLDARLYSPPAANVRRNVRYDNEVECTANIYRNLVRMPGGNPWILDTHGGSFKANDKTEFAESGNAGIGGREIMAYFSRDDIYTPDTQWHFDVISPHYKCRAQEGMAQSAISQTYEIFHDELAGGLRVGVKGRPAHLTASIRSLQRCIQHFKRHAAYWGLNPDMGFGYAHSVGGATLIGAAMDAPPRYAAGLPGRFDAHHDSTLLGVVVNGAEVDWDPYQMFIDHSRFMTGCIENDKTISGIRGDVERLFLEPNVAGLRPAGSPKTQLCKSVSPVDLIAAATGERARTFVRAYYFKDFLGGTFENTLVAQGDYPGIPPYNASGHDWRQWAILQAACAAKDTARGDGRVMFSGRVLDAAAYTPGTIGNPTYEALESTLAETYKWACDTLDAL